jgi:hypothetical protein
MNIIKCFTSFTFSYLSRALLLARTLKQAHPEWHLVAVIVDTPPATYTSTAVLYEFDELIYASDLGIPDFRSWLFKHDIVEASTAVKGYALKTLLDSGASKVVYFDPDIAIFNRLDGLIGELERSSVILTPHQVAANATQTAVQDNELTALKYGIYNLGFVAVRNDSTGNEFADWWKRQLHFACYDEVENGIFTDQKWCDLVPALFPKVYIERDPGCNVASWNLSTRRMKFSPDGNILVNDCPLKFYHYTKINSEGDFMTERYADENLEVIEVWNWYKRALSKIMVEGIPKGYWGYGTFSNGIKIPKGVRLYYRRNPELMSRFRDPFTTDSNSFYYWLQHDYPELLLDKVRTGFEAI